MRILMVSIFSHHFFNWVLQLEKSGHEIYWFDISDTGVRLEKISFVKQIVGWSRKIDYPGRYTLKNKVRPLYEFIDLFNKRDLNKFFEKKIIEIQPDVIQSFELHSGCGPILATMGRFPEIKWIYSCWGNDMFYHRDNSSRRREMKEVMKRIDYLFTDCRRDLFIAKEMGFKGRYLGTFPGGGGYNLKELSSCIQPFNTRSTILIKGYQNHYGRCNNVLLALIGIQDLLNNLKIVVFGATQEVYDFIEDTPALKQMSNLEIKGRIGFGEVSALMGESVIYIGNNVSDGIPNTMLEAIIFEAFPIQSNPGGATAEIVTHGRNGFLIENPENIEEIQDIIIRALRDRKELLNGIQWNNHNIKTKLEREHIKSCVMAKYDEVQLEILEPKRIQA